MSEPFWEPLAGAPGPAGPAGPTRAGLLPSCSEPPGGNWNSAIDNGWWMSSTAANSPAAGNWFMGEVIQHNPSWVIQRLYSFTQASGLMHPTFVRSCVNGAWSAWQRQMVTVSGTAMGGTDSGGNLWLNYGYVFNSNPIVVVCNANGPANGEWILYSIAGVSTSSFAVHGTNSTTGASIGAGININVNWIATGT